MNNCKEQFKKKYIKQFYIHLKFFFLYMYKNIYVIYLENVFFAKMHLYNVNMIQIKIGSIQ